MSGPLDALSPILRTPGNEPGAEPEPVVLAHRAYGPLELFLFSAAGWHPHRIHFDHPYATDVEGHPGLLVHGPLQAVHLVDALLDALEVPATVRSLTYRHLAPLTVGEEAVVKARTLAVDEQGSEATFEVWMERAADGERTTGVVAVVERTRRAAVSRDDAGETTGASEGEMAR